MILKKVSVGSVASVQTGSLYKKGNTYPLFWGRKTAVESTGTFTLPTLPTLNKYIYHRKKDSQKK